MTVIGGYDWREVNVYGKGYVPIHDINGRQFCYVLNMLQEFCTKLHELPLSFVLYEGDASTFSSKISQVSQVERSFDRIEVSNVADLCFLGLEKTLESFGPLLKRPAVNPHATLITLLMTAVLQARHHRGRPWAEQQLPAQWGQLLSWFPFPVDTISRDHPQYIQYDWARDLIWDCEEMFGFYWTQMINAQVDAARTGMRERKENKIIDKWPVGKRADPKTRLLGLLASGRAGYERYVEWNRKE